MKKEDWVSWLIVINAIMIVFSIWILITNYIYSGNETLISAGVGLIGAIVGGIISGVLTLLGVRITIKDNEDKRNMDLIPKKLMDIEDIIFILEIQNDLINKINDNFNHPVQLNPRYKELIKYIIDYMDEDGLLKKSANVNLITYQTTRSLYNYFKEVSLNQTILTYPYEQIVKELCNAIDNLNVERNKLIDKMMNSK